MIMQGQAECLTGLIDLLGHSDVSLRWCRITGRVIVDQNQGAGVEFQGAFGHFSGVGWDVVYGASGLSFVGYERVFCV